MKPAFPGMNPYLEQPDLWSEVHFGLISALARSLNPVLIPKYRAAVEKRVYSDSLLVGIPDVTVFQSNPEVGSAVTQPVTTQALSQPVASQPVTVTLPVIEEIREHYLEIRQVGTGQVIAVIEILSSKNKRPGKGREQYSANRNQILSSRSHLVEIDLLRAGEPQPMLSGITSDYRILVSRAGKRPQAELYAFNLRQPMPLFALPLQAGDPEPIIDLNLLLAEVYDEAALDLAIDYGQPPVPAVVHEDWHWIQALSRANNIS